MDIGSGADLTIVVGMGGGVRADACSMKYREAIINGLRTAVYVG